MWIGGAISTNRSSASATAEAAALASSALAVAPLAAAALAPAALAAAALAAGADAQPREPRPLPDRTTFKCQDGRDLTAEFASRHGAFVAIVDAGDGPHALPYRAPDPGPVKLVWSDGRRTLTWSPGVQIMWLDGTAHRMCGRAGHRH